MPFIKRINLLVVAAGLLLLLLVGLLTIPAFAGDEPCVPQEGQSEVWANFSPNNHKEPFVGPPLWPTDPRGTWHTHDKIPGGHEGPDGVYARGNAHKGGDWFYRQAGKPAVDCPDPEDPVEEPTEDPTEEPTETPTVTPTTPTETPTTPTETPTVTTTTPTQTPVSPQTPVQEPVTPTEDDDPAEEPETEESDPVVSTETFYEENKSVKVHTHESGEVTRDVTHYDPNRNDEGL